MICISLQINHNFRPMGAILNMNSRALLTSLLREVARVTNLGEAADKGLLPIGGHIDDSCLNLVFQDIFCLNWPNFLQEAIFGDF